ncbi:hypothetical protein [Bradyrhizobium sp. SYSU BS000235]|uniref:hypothetical protein n=1 Tax=Bradyrhizobium sp. SYSU BS000235 TaxID=3411332 RepID=UPI003C74F0F6
MSMVGFPLLLIPLAIYNIFVFLMPGVAFSSPVVSVTLMSGVVWTVTFGDALLALAMVLLMFEVIKAARPGARYVTDHLLSLILFGAATAEFVLLAPFGNSTFFLLVVLTAIEFLAGLVIGIRNRSRRVRADAPVATPAPVRREPVAPATPAPVPAERAAPEPTRPDPIPAERAPVHNVTVEEPKPTAPVVTPTEPAREPELKPAPSIATLQTAESSAAERKIADWNVSHLIKDNEAEAAKDVSDKPVDPPASSKP